MPSRCSPNMPSRWSALALRASCKARAGSLGVGDRSGRRGRASVAGAGPGGTAGRARGRGVAGGLRHRGVHPRRPPGAAPCGPQRSIEPWSRLADVRPGRYRRRALGIRLPGLVLALVAGCKAQADAMLPRGPSPGPPPVAARSPERVAPSGAGLPRPLNPATLRFVDTPALQPPGGARMQIGSARGHDTAVLSPAGDILVLADEERGVTLVHVSSARALAWRPNLACGPPSRRSKSRPVASPWSRSQPMSSGWRCARPSSGPWWCSKSRRERRWSRPGSRRPGGWRSSRTDGSSPCSRRARRWFSIVPANEPRCSTRRRMAGARSR